MRNYQKKKFTEIVELPRDYPAIERIEQIDAVIKIEDSQIVEGLPVINYEHASFEGIYLMACCSVREKVSYSARCQTQQRRVYYRERKTYVPLKLTNPEVYSVMRELRKGSIILRPTINYIQWKVLDERCFRQVFYIGIQVMEKKQQFNSNQQALTQRLCQSLLVEKVIKVGCENDAIEYLEDHKLRNVKVLEYKLQERFKKEQEGQLKKYLHLVIGAEVEGEIEYTTKQTHGALKKVVYDAPFMLELVVPDSYKETKGVKIKTMHVKESTVVINEREILVAWMLLIGVQLKKCSQVRVNEDSF